jgi:hypothetical protein
MNKYVVAVYATYAVDIEVEAENEDEAKEKANDYIEENECEFEYYETQDVDQWETLKIGEVK